jgi:hypothetical protein
VPEVATRGLLEDDRRRLSLAPGNPPATHWTDRLRTGLRVLLQLGAPGNCRPMSLLLTSAAPSRLAFRDTEVTEENLVDGNATQQFEVVEKLSGA